MYGLRAVAALMLVFCALCAGSCTRQRETHRTRTGTLTVALLQEPVSLDPLLLEGPIAYAVSELLYVYLTNYDSAGNMVPDVALVVPTQKNGGVSADGKRVTFHLRRGVLWQDGSPLTSRDVVFTYRAIMNPANNIPTRYGYDRITSIAAPDPYTVVIGFARPFSPIVPMFLGGDSNYPILPEHVLGRSSSINSLPFNQTPVGAGPYIVDTWAHGERLELRANPRYYRGSPAIETIVLPFIHDPSTTVNQLRTGEIDASFALDASRIALLHDLPAHRIVVTPIPYFYAIGFNLTDPELSDVNVRHALALAVNREVLVRKVSHGIYDPRTGLRGLFTWAFNADADRLQYNPQTASRLLERAGWTLKRDGTRWKGGRRLQLQLAFPTGSDITTQLATGIAAAESAIGVDVVLKRYSREVYMLNDGPVMQGRYQMSLYDYHSNYDPDAAWMLACDQRGPHGFNDARYCNHAVDAALTRASSLYERPARRAVYSGIQSRIMNDLPYFFLAQASEIDVIPRDLSGFKTPLLSAFNSVQDWSFGTPKKRR